MKAENKNMRWMNEPEKWKVSIRSIIRHMKYATVVNNSLLFTSKDSIKKRTVPIPLGFVSLGIWHVDHPIKRIRLFTTQSGKGRRHEGDLSHGNRFLERDLAWFYQR